MVVPSRQLFQVGSSESRGSHQEVAPGRERPAARLVWAKERRLPLSCASPRPLPPFLGRSGRCYPAAPVKMSLSKPFAAISPLFGFRRVCVEKIVLLVWQKPTAISSPARPFWQSIRAHEKNTHRNRKPTGVFLGDGDYSLLLRRVGMECALQSDTAGTLPAANAKENHHGTKT